ncbi:hypothetical protein RBU61_08905 [Tissierella sp. MB52-C2]|uniref:hypothetical protein n=1 Tax=Tissierella sp. MB52-C2 TaxID=3070999 RepID=UPI00280C0183|nr:hypothetical protein [Tissierella sp. MB52-C2]WMM26784.1 hypothetical protein RBU61_08905 [Tissierella sp. MB52-C2]
MENDYALGFIEGLNKAFKKQKEANQEWGLVLVRDQAVIDEYNNKKFKDIINTNTKLQGFRDAYYQGIEDGEYFSTSDRIAGEEAKQLQDGTYELFNTDDE